MAVIAGGRGSHAGLLTGAFSVMALLEGSRFLKDFIPTLDAGQLAAVRLILIGLGLILLGARPLSNPWRPAAVARGTARHDAMAGGYARADTRSARHTSRAKLRAAITVKFGFVRLVKQGVDPSEHALCATARGKGARMQIEGASLGRHTCGVAPP